MRLPISLADSALQPPSGIGHATMHLFPNFTAAGAPPMQIFAVGWQHSGSTLMSEVISKAMDVSVEVEALENCCCNGDKCPQPHTRQLCTDSSFLDGPLTNSDNSTSYFDLFGGNMSRYYESCAASLNHAVVKADDMLWQFDALYDYVHSLPRGAPAWSTQFIFFVRHPLPNIRSLLAWCTPAGGKDGDRTWRSCEESLREKRVRESNNTLLMRIYTEPRSGKLAGTPAALARLWVAGVQTYLANPRHFAALLRYEDVIADPVKEARRAISAARAAYAGSWPPARSEIKATSVNATAVHEIFAHQFNQPGGYDHEVGDGDLFDDAITDEVISICKMEMRKLGYTREGISSVPWTESSVRNDSVRRVPNLQQSSVGEAGSGEAGSGEAGSGEAGSGEAGSGEADDSEGSSDSINSINNTNSTAPNSTVLSIKTSVSASAAVPPLTYLLPVTPGACCAHCAERSAKRFRVRFEDPNDKQRGTSCTCGFKGVNAEQENSKQKDSPRSVDDCSREEMPRRVLLGVSTGYAGSATLSNGKSVYSNEDCYSNSSDFLFNFEVKHIYRDTKKLKDTGLNAWYASLYNASDSEEYAAARKLAKSTIVPDMLVYARKRMRKLLKPAPLRDLTYVDLGHHTNDGMLGPLIDELASPTGNATPTEVGVIRIVRNRYDTVRSIMSEDKVPCDAETNGMYELCPLRHKVHLQPPPGVWDTLDTSQKWLWYIDEVEARWQSVLGSHPELQHTNLTWCAHDDFSTGWEKVATTFMSNGTLHPAECSSHTHTDPTKELDNDEVLAIKDSEYLRLMRYDRNATRMLAATQQAAVCAQYGHVVYTPPPRVLESGAALVVQ